MPKEQGIPSNARNVKRYITERQVEHYTADWWNMLKDIETNRKKIPLLSMTRPPIKGKSRSMVINYYYFSETLLHDKYMKEFG